MLDRVLYDQLNPDAKDIANSIHEKLCIVMENMLVLRADTDMNREELAELFDLSEPTVAELETY
jgi:DNA-binding XRE family transcriptional regulator